jgi:hypothetical protein
MSLIFLYFPFSLFPADLFAFEVRVDELSAYLEPKIVRSEEVSSCSATFIQSLFSLTPSLFPSFPLFLFRVTEPSAYLEPVIDKSGEGAATPRTVIQVFLNTVSKHGDRPALALKRRPDVSNHYYAYILQSGFCHENLFPTTLML